MTGNDSEGSTSVYGSDVEIVTRQSAASTTSTASNKVELKSASVKLFIPYPRRVAVHVYALFCNFWIPWTHMHL